MLKEKVKPLIQKRTSSKRAITRILNKLADPNLDDSFVRAQVKLIKEKQVMISDIDENILAEYHSSPYCESLSTFIQNE